MSTRKIHRVSAATASVVLIFIIAGCGNSTSGSAGSAAATATSSSSSEAQPSSPAPAGTPGLTNSSGTQLPQVGSYEGIDFADCFDFPTVRAAMERSCDEPHDAEMFVTDAPTGLDAIDAQYPTYEQWQQLSATLCHQPFADYAGQSIEETTELSISLIFPLATDWDDVSRRSLSCAIVSIDGTPLLGSKHA